MAGPAVTGTDAAHRRPGQNHQVTSSRRTTSQPTSQRARRNLRTRGAVLALTAALALTACGDDGPSATVEQGSSGAENFDAPVPEVTENATDLEKEPKLAAGAGTAPTTLVTRDLVTGDGKTAVETDTVGVRYVGALFSDGSVFDSSWAQGMEPATFPLDKVVPGFAQGIVGMKIGGRREIVIPPDLGYQDQALPGLPANSTLVFVVDLVETSSGD